MRNIHRLLVGAIISVGGVSVFADTPEEVSERSKAASAYDRTQPYPAYEAPQLAIGQPDIQGVWTNTTLTSTTRPARLGDRLVYTEEEVAELEQSKAETLALASQPTEADAPAEHQEPEGVSTAAGVGSGAPYNEFWTDRGNTVMRVNGEPRTSLFTTPDGQAPARKPGARPAPAPEPAAFVKLLGPGPSKGASYDNPESRSSERCIVGFGRNAGPPMFSNGWYNNNYQIVQTPDHVMIATEMIHDARIIRLNAEHRTDDARPYFGDSIGWWEGDTLVVETTHIPYEQQYMGSWKDLKVTERFRRVADDRLYYGFTIEDPTLWEEPWGGEYEFDALNDRVHEYACHEGNYSLPGILRGAREQERQDRLSSIGADEEG